MVHVKYALNDNHFSLSVSGHAGYAEKGKDIVCAGVSALVRALQVCLEKDLSLTDAADVRKTVSDGYACFRVSGFNDPEQQMCIFTFFYMCVMGLYAIEEQYPEWIFISDISSRSRDSDIDTSEQTTEDE